MASVTRFRALTGWVQVEPLLAVILWGGIYPGAKLGLQEIPPLSFTSLRIIIAVAVLFAAASRTRQIYLPRHLWRPLVMAGLAQTVFQGLLIAGLNRTSAGNSAILLATAPLLTAGWLALTSHDRLTRLQLCGLLIGLGGVAIVVQGGTIGGGWSHLGGDLLALGAAGAWAWYGLTIGPLVKGQGALQATGWTMLVAALFFTPLLLVQAGDHTWGSVSWEAWAGLVYGATAGMVVAMALWGRSVHRLGPKQTMVYAYLEPVSAVVLAALLLGEPLVLLQAAGALLAFIGVWLAS